MAALVVLVTATTAAPVAQAQTYPTRDITLVVPYKPGGSTDPIARSYAAQLSKILPGQVNIENKPGGSATVGIGSVVRAKPDGYTIGLGTYSALAYQPLVNTGLPYKTPDDYTSIVKLVELPAVLTVRSDAPWKTFQEFIEDARKNPGKIRVSVSGIRESSDLALQQLNKAADLKLVSVPFTGGGGEALVALLGKRVEATIGFGPGSVGHVQAGTVRALAVFMKGTYPLFPEAASVVDAGYDANLQAVYNIVAPKGLPRDVHDKLVAASLVAVNSPEFIAFAKDKGYVADGKNPEQMRAELIVYSQKFKDLLQFLNQNKSSLTFDDPQFMFQA